MAATSIRFDPNKLSRLVGLAYGASLARSAWREFANDMAAVSGSQLAMIQYIDEDRPERSFLACGGLGDDFEKEFAKTSWQSKDDQFWVAIRNKPAGTIKLSHEIMVHDAMHKSPDYSRVASPWNLEHFLISSITTGNGVSAFLSLGRTAKRPQFVPGDKTLFNKLVLSHLRRSFVLHRELDAARQTNAVLLATFDASPYGLVAFECRGRPVGVNQMASKIFETSDGLTMINGRLHATDPAVHARLESALSITVQSALGAMIAPPDPVIVPRRNHKRPYQVLFSQLSLRNSDNGLPAGSAVVALITEGWLADPAYLPINLRSTYGLTRAEIRLCQAMLEGKSLSEAAETLAVSRNTAKTHLGRIFSKMGITSQAALLRLLARGARGPELPILNDPSIAGSRAHR